MSNVFTAPVNSLITYERQPLHEDHDVLEHKGFVGHPNDTEPNWRRLLERKFPLEGIHHSRTD